MSQSPIQAAIQQICQEKNLSEEAVLHAIEMALAAAYRKDFGNKMQNIITEFDSKTGAVKVFDVKTVVEDLPEEELASMEAEAEIKAESPSSSFVAEENEDGEPIKKFNPKTEIQLSPAKEINKKYELGDEIITPLEVPGEFGRMAAQTAKQVIIQKIREVERENIFNEYKSLEHQVVNGAVQRREGRNVLVDLDHATAIMPIEEQSPGERYSIGNRMKFYLVLVEQTSRGPQLIVSRSHPDIVKKIFELEIPEVANGAIEIKSLAREAGNRSKIAIISNDENIDPIGSCVGQRGTRIQTIIHELNGEKVDIILWDENPVKFITNALSPAKAQSVELLERENEKVAKVAVRDDQLSLAIGRAGQNVRLASKLTGWRIDIVSGSQPVAPPPAVIESAESTESAGASENKNGLEPSEVLEPPEVKLEPSGVKESKAKVKEVKKPSSAKATAGKPASAPAATKVMADKKATAGKEKKVRKSKKKKEVPEKDMVEKDIVEIAE
ncbi:MAG: transcription termination factor NusA [Patescibacteria group bacterium]